MEVSKKNGGDYPRDKWSTCEVDILRQMKEEGMSARKIAMTGRLPHSLNAIQKKLGRMGLVTHSKIIKFNGRQRDEFRHFLRENWEGKTPQELADLWNSNVRRPRTNKRRVVSYLSRLGIKIHYSEVQSINRLRVKESRIRKSARSPREFEEMIRAARIEVMRRRIGLGRDIWSGMPMEHEESSAEIAT
jgi:hypothetical protein